MRQPHASYQHDSSVLMMQCKPGGQVDDGCSVSVFQVSGIPGVCVWANKYLSVFVNEHQSLQRQPSHLSQSNPEVWRAAWAELCLQYGMG